MIRNKGFTLLEILIVMAVILLVSIGSYVGFVQFNRQQNLTSAWDTLRNNLNEARSNSMSQVILTGACNQASQTLVGHQVRFYAPPGASHYYNLEEVCSAGSETTALEKTVYLPSGVVFTSIPSPSSPLRFLIITGAVSNPVTVTIGNGKRTVNISVDSVGVIR